MTRPRIGFLGTGWIGRDRMRAIVQTGLVDAVALVEPSEEAAAEALALAPGARRVDDLEALLALELNGVVIATPSALHAPQTIQALEAGCAVFCQKPLGRTGAEAAHAVAAAREANCLLAVDLSYRFTDPAQQVRDLVRSGELGRVFAADLTFHNAYGPDKPWFYDRRLSGGGCVADLGVHLVDLALWTLDFPEVVEVSSRLFAGGEPLAHGDEAVEDYAVATLTTADGAAIRIACSWRLQAGREAVIAAEFHGTQGGAAVLNENGSFYALAGERRRGTTTERLPSSDEPWGGRAAADWARRLAAGDRYSAEAEQTVTVARVLDRIYGG